MAKNYAFKKDNLEDITIEDFKLAICAAMNSGINHVAPLGCSGDDFLLYGRFIPYEESEDGNWHRESMVTIRNYCGTPELLVTDKEGNFLFYGKMFGELDFVASEYFRIFILFKDKICSVVDKTEIKFTDDCDYDTKALAILTSYYNAK